MSIGRSARCTVSLTEDVEEQLQRLVEITGDSKSGILAEWVSHLGPALKMSADALDAAREQQATAEQVKQELLKNLEMLYNDEAKAAALK